MRNQLIYITLILLFYSCKSDIKLFLTNGNNRTWYYSNNIDNLPIFFTFYSNGKLQVTKEDIYGHLSDFSISDCVEWKKEWFIKDDTLLYLGLYPDEVFQIKKQDETTLSLENQNRKIILQAIKHLKSFAKKKHERRKMIVDSLYKIHYKIKVDTMIPSGNYIFLYGDTTFSKEFVRFTQAEKEVINPQKGDILIKKKNWILLNKVTPDTLCLYVYSINMNNFNHLELFQEVLSDGMKWDKMNNDIIYE